MDQNIVVGSPGQGPISRTAAAIAVEVLVHGAESRVRLAERLNLSPATLTRLVKPLLAAGVLVEADAVRNSAMGRSALLLDVLQDDYRFVGVKLTSDTAYGVLTDLRAQVLRTASRALTDTDPGAVVRAVRDVAAELGRERRPDGVGVTLGGRVRDGVVVDSPYLGWSDVPFAHLLGQGDVPHHVDNDVVGLINAEHWFGWGRGYPDFALLTIGAGIGYGLVLHDRLVPVVTGPVGHLPIDAGGPLCPAGHRGCLSSYATIPAITAAASLGHRAPLTFEQVAGLAREADPVALRVLREAAWAVGRAIATIADVTSVPRVILSGEAIALTEVAQPSLDAGLREYHPDESSPVDVVVQPADFYEWARGAAVLAIQRVFPRAPR